MKQTLVKSCAFFALFLSILLGIFIIGFGIYFLTKVWPGNTFRIVLAISGFLFSAAIIIFTGIGIFSFMNSLTEFKEEIDDIEEKVETINENK